MHGVAEVAGPATLAVPSEEAAIMKRWLDRDLHPQVDKSMADAICCDYVQIAQVYDLRELRLTWPSLEIEFKIKVPFQSQGFPSIGGSSLRAAVVAFCNSCGVPVRRRSGEE